MQVSPASCFRWIKLPCVWCFMAEKIPPKIEAGYEKVRATVLVSGSVQGVFFRSSIRAQAKLLEIFGWSRNTSNGNIECVFEGDKDQVEKLISYCWKGPPGAYVRDVNVEWQIAKHDLRSFEIKY